VPRALLYAAGQQGLAQAAAVIAAQHLDYPAYLARLRAAPVQDLLKRPSGEPYPHGAAETIVLALDAAADTDPGGLCRGLVDVIALLSAGGVPREHPPPHRAGTRRAPASPACLPHRSSATPPRSRRGRHRHHPAAPGKGAGVRGER
jgi:hypothetical protein